MRRTVTSLCALALASVASAQQFGPWRVLGRFEAEFNGQSTFKATPVEKLLADMQPGKPGPKFDETYKGPNDATLAWRDLGAKEGANAIDVGVIDLAQATANGGKFRDNDVTSYLYRRIDCDSATEVAVLMGSDDGLRAWLNGSLIAEVHDARVLSVRDHYVVLKLAAGANHLLIKVTNLAGPYTFQMAPWSRVSSEAINAAIDRGVAFVIDTQLADGTWGFHDDFGGGHAAFTAYTLLKCGVRADHPAVQLALAAAESRALDTTYSTSSLILALVATKDAAAKPRIEELCRDLIDMQDGSGAYSYPLYPGDKSDRPVDLSCTLFAALALHAASDAGVETDAGVWIDLANGTLRFLERPRQMQPPGTTGVRVAGFSYRVGEGVTGSMTSAGLSVLAIAELEAGAKFSAALRNEIAAARALGLEWLAHNMAWSNNPGAGRGHHLFWIYGVERAGALLEREKFGDVDWYADGAAYLIQGQAADGHWNPDGYEDHEYMDTLLALLFLKRATHRATGERTQSAAHVFETADPKAEVALRATGSAPLTIWITELRDPAIARDGTVQIEEIEYFARLAGDAGEPTSIGHTTGGRVKPVDLTRFALRHDFTRSGAWLVSARVRISEPEALELESPELEVRVEAALDATRLAYASDVTRNLLFDAEAKCVASSSRGDKQLASNVVDGRLSTRWQCALTELEPWIRITPERSVKADRVVLSHARARARHASEARAHEIEVIVNAKERFTAEMNPDVLAKTVVSFGGTLSIKQIEVRVLSSLARELGKECVGFSEIELLRGR